MEKQIDIPVNVISDDIQAVLRSNPLMVVQVQNQALMRRIKEMDNEIARLTTELEKSQNGKSKKEG
jgi:uncharacterized small protein (DUF1192 family)